MTASQYLLQVGTVIIAYGLYKLYGILYGAYTSTIKDFPGPSSGNLVTGNLRVAMFSDQPAIHQDWVDQYGPTFKFKSVFLQNFLFTLDVKAISHIMKKDSFVYQKPVSLGYTFRRLLGEGLLLADGDVHKRQRKVLNPAFSPAEIKRFTEIFFDKAIKLRDIWTSFTAQHEGETRVEALTWLSKVALDVIGEAGFGYKFDSLTEQEDRTNELHEAFKAMFRVGTQPTLTRLLRGIVPITRYMPTERDSEFEQSRNTMNRIGNQLLTERKLAWDSHHSDKAPRGASDILSLLVNANMEASRPSHQRLSDEHVLAQIPTFIVAGHETTSTGIAWTLLSLCKNQSVQSKLREELLAVGTENPTMDELNALPYLDAVLREALRLHSPVPSTIRVAAQDDVLPLQTPVIDKNGKAHHEIKIVKGQAILMSVTMLNRLESIWGEDANEFNPDRWNSPPQAAIHIPGVWGNTLVFFGGPRACIGYRFALIEMKAVLFTLIRAFEFDLAVPAEDILRRTEIVTRPVLKTDLSGPNQLPLIIRPISRC